MSYGEHSTRINLTDICFAARVLKDGGTMEKTDLGKKTGVSYDWIVGCILILVGFLIMFVVGYIGGAGWFK